jgi:outer membrane protein
MKRLYTLLLLTGLWSAASAQQGGQSFTLEQCIQYALENSVNIQNAKVDEQIAQAKVRETTGIGLPQVTANGSITHNQKLQRFFMAYQPGPGGGIIDVGKEPGLNPGDVIAAPNFFQLKSAGDMGVSINQMIFNGSYFIGLKASKAYKDLAYKTTDQTREQTVQQVSKAYYTVVINKERTSLFNTNIGRVDSLLRNTKALNANGFAESIDVDRIQVTLNNLVVERDKFLNLNELGLQLLKFQMNYPMDQAIEVVGNIDDIQIDPSLTSYQEGWDYKNRTDFKVLEANRRLQELNIRSLYAGSLPSLSAFANLGYATQSSDIAGLFKTNTNIAAASDTVRAVFGADKWYSYSQFGIRLTVPLFTGLQQTYKIQQQKLALLKIENNSRLLKSSIDLEISQSSINFNNALKTLQAQRSNMDLASNVARVTKIKYEQGVGSNIEVIDAESALKEAQVNYYNALFDALVAKVDLDKAYGKFNTQPTETK